MRSKRHLENIKQIDLIIPEWLVKEQQEPVKNKYKKIYNPKTLKQMARENNQLNDKELNKELAEK